MAEWVNLGSLVFGLIKDERIVAIAYFDPNRDLYEHAEPDTEGAPFIADPSWWWVRTDNPNTLTGMPELAPLTDGLTGDERKHRVEEALSHVAGFYEEGN